MPIPDRIRYFNKRFLNRLTLKIAGAAHSPIAAVEHIGRKSGKRYRTPVMVERLEHGFMFALTYGPGVDWYRNLLAAGKCTLFWNGGIYQLENPQTVDVETGVQAFPSPANLILKRIHIEHFFKMQIADSDPGAGRS